MNSYLKLSQNTWRDCPCVICGAGPSLINYDFDNCSNIHVISVNSSIIKMPWQFVGSEDLLRAWISNDSLCRKWDYFEKVISYKCEKIVRDSWLKYKEDLIDFLYFSPRSSKEDVINEGDEGLAYNSSVPTAIDFAIKLNFKNIFIIGVDHSSFKNLTHFWQFYSKNEQPKERLFICNKKIFRSPDRIMARECVQKKSWDMNMSVFSSLKKVADKKNILINSIDCGNKILPFNYCSFEESGLYNYGIKFMSILKYP